MKTYSVRHRYYNYVKWEKKLHQPYDYERNGLLRHLLSHKIVESNNSTLKALLTYIENSFVMVMKYVERMQNFKNPAYFNR